MKIPFNRPFVTGKELGYIGDVLQRGHLSGDGTYTRQCSRWLEATFGVPKALLTHSCTAALEMAALLAELAPGDEVIMPSFTFVSTANAFVLRGAVPVFVDIRPDTLNIDESLIERAITSRTRAIVPVHYAGVSCVMDVITDIAKRHGLLVIEDAAQGIFSKYRGRPVGALGDMSALSFHETKNIVSGEGGALLLSDERYAQRAEIIREKGTNRSQFFRGQVDKYTWTDIGSSYLPSELIAAFLWAQMEEAKMLMDRRMSLWNSYHEAFAGLEASERIRRPIIPADCEHNAHMYYLLLRNLEDRTNFISRLKERDILAVFHYIPLGDSPVGRKYGRNDGEMAVTRDVADRLVRMPLWVGLEDHQEMVITTALEALAD